ncbi:AbrB/MazE/SpoVT family DNA-binding domain-containing protein [Candidatus Woesearchaeota archaeon]|nr:AbrB/MazE/SpoVT family DNA-binding domain-containing protein [Candidatus Woesearchaeota archaeon]
MIETIHVSSKGQIVIPERVRKELHIKSGSKLFLIQKGETLILKKEEEIARYFDEDEKKERLGWMLLAEQSLKKIWDNPKDEAVWKKYL